MTLEELRGHVLSHLIGQGTVHRDHLAKSLQTAHDVPDHAVPQFHHDVGRVLDMLHSEGMLIPNPEGWLQLSPIGAAEAARLVGG